MNKAELVDAMAARTKQSKKDTEESLNAFLDVVKSQVSRGDKITLVGFGSFERRDRAARVGRDPRDPQKTIQIPAKKVAAAKLTFKV